MLHAVLTNPKLKAELSNADIMSITTPCQGRSVLRAMMKVDPNVRFAEDELFLLSCALIDELQPKRVVSEMTPPNKQYSSEHYAVAAHLLIEQSSDTRSHPLIDFLPICVVMFKVVKDGSSQEDVNPKANVYPLSVSPQSSSELRDRYPRSQTLQ